MMKALLIVIGMVVVIGGGWYWLKKTVKPEEKAAVGNNMVVNERIVRKYEEAKLGLSDNSEKINLSSVGKIKGLGMAVREVSGEVFLHTILAELPDPEVGKFYEGWLVRESDKSVVYSGRLELRKGGWMLEYVGKKDLNDHKLVVVTLESKDDQKPETHILEGRFD